MDALAFAKMGLDELKSRLAQIGDIKDQSSANYGSTPEEVVQKFFDDQGLNFGNIDIPAVLALTGSAPTKSTPNDPLPTEDAPQENG